MNCYRKTYIFFSVFISIFEISFSSRLLNFICRKNVYTPLLFFKFPNGHIEASDRMERIVRRVEKNLDLKIERFDILKDRFAIFLYRQIDENSDFIGKMPLLYHRESQRCIYGLASEYHVSAWAKGRLLLRYAEGHINETLKCRSLVPDDNVEEIVDIKQQSDKNSEWESKRLDIRSKRLDHIQRLTSSFNHDESKHNSTSIFYNMSNILSKARCHKTVRQNELSKDVDT